MSWRRPHPSTNARPAPNLLRSVRVLAPGWRCSVSRLIARLKPSIPKHRRTLVAKREPARDSKTGRVKQRRPAKPKRARNRDGTFRSNLDDAFAAGIPKVFRRPISF